MIQCSAACSIQQIKCLLTAVDFCRSRNVARWVWAFGARFFGGVGTGFNTGFGGGFGGGFSEPPTVQNPNQRAPAPVGSFGPGFAGGLAGSLHRQFFIMGIKWQ